MIPRFFIQSFVLLGFVLSACSTPSNASTIGQAGFVELLGRVVDDSGIPLAQANVKTSSVTALTDSEGWFHISTGRNVQWITVYKTGYITRTRAAAPGTPVLIRVSPDDGKTIVLKFTGDVMFGRRFFDPNSDGNLGDGLLPVNPSTDDHLKLLQTVKPLLMDSDITAINLETVLDSRPYFPSTGPRPVGFHPTKEFYYASHPDAVTALMQDGVNMIGLGNNHIYDKLDPGMTSTLNYLDELGLPHFGAGLNEKEAWKPAILTIKGEKIAYIACTTIFVSNGILKPGEITYVASDSSKKGGAAHCEKNRLRTEVENAKKISDIVIVMIHGGNEYETTIPENPFYLSDIAQKAGALVVVNHHPHVVSGFSWQDGKIIGRTLGNFVFDQTIWPSLESYIFTVYIRDRKIIRAFIEPTILQDYISRGVTNNLADTIVRNAAGLEAGPFVMESDTMEFDMHHTSKTETKTFVLDGGSGTLIQIPHGQWLSNFTGTGTLKLGRDLLWVGEFEPDVVGDAPGYLPLWEQTASSNLETGPDFAYAGKIGIRLSRGSANEQSVVSTNLHRLLVKPYSQITVCGMYRVSSGANASVQISFYPDTKGPSSEHVIRSLDVSNVGQWRYFQVDLSVPENIVALQAFLKLSPPTTGTATVDFDNIRVIEWAPQKKELGALYNFAYLIGKGNLTFSQSVLPGGNTWLTVAKTDISKFIVGQQTP